MVGLIDIALALYAEAGKAMTGELGEQGAGYAFDVPGEGNVLQNRFVTTLVAMQNGSTVLMRLALVAFAGGSFDCHDGVGGYTG